MSQEGWGVILERGSCERSLHTRICFLHIMITKFGCEKFMAGALSIAQNILLFNYCSGASNIRLVNDYYVTTGMELNRARLGV